MKKIKLIFAIYCISVFSLFSFEKEEIKTFTGKTIKSVKGEIIVEIGEENKDKIMKKLEKLGYTKITKLYKNIYLATHKEKISFNTAKTLLQNNFKYYPNIIFKTLYTPQDPSITNQYYLEKIHAPQAWDFEEYKTTITLALVDTGIDASHDDLSSIVYSTQVVITIDNNGNIVVSEEYKPNIRYSYFHGTAVSGVAAAIRDNYKGIAGVAKMMIYSFDIFRSADEDGGIPLSVAIRGLSEVKERLSTIDGKVIVNMSLGAPDICSPVLQSVISDIYNYDNGRKFILVAAAGNDSSDVNTPANCIGVVPVSALDENDKLAWFSSYGSKLKSQGLSAPGINIYTTLPDNIWSSTWETQPINGTSFSAPIVSAVMGAVWAKRPDLKNYEVIDIVRKTARDIGDDGPDEKYGWGVVDLYRAISYLEANLDEKGIIKKIVAWPNPFYISKHQYIRFSVDDSILYPDDKLMIFDFSGAFISYATKDGLKGFMWDGKNQNGNYVAPGPYIAYYKSKKGTAKTKFLLLR